MPGIISHGGNRIKKKKKTRHDWINQQVDFDNFSNNFLQDLNTYGHQDAKWTKIACCMSISVSWFIPKYKKLERLAKV